LTIETPGVSIWEEDFSAVKRAIDGLRRSGVTDFRRYLTEHPEFVREAIGMVRIVDVNDWSLRMFGAADKSELLASLDRIFLPETDTSFVEELMAVAEGRELVESEARVRTLQDEPFDVLFTMVFSPDDPELRSVRVTLMDITARKRAESALRDEAQMLETLNRIGSMLAAEVDLERVVQAVTDAGTTLSGAHFGAFFYNVKNASGGSYLLYTLSGAPREAFDRFGMPRNTAVFEPTFSGREVVRLDDVTSDPRYGRNAPHHGMPEGHLPVRSYLAVPVVSRSDEVLGGLFFGHPDPGVFTERAQRLVTGIASQAAVAIDNARLHEQRRQLIHQLREADRRKDEFLATLSHELRNPLAPIRNALQAMRLKERHDPAVPRLQEMMMRQVDHLVRLVDDLLEMSRINHGVLDLRKENVTLAAIVRNAVETNEPWISAGGHELVVSEPDETLWIDGDSVRLAQILSNLLNNAAKYTDPGGRIEVRARREDGFAVVSVRDDGPGIAAESLPRLFETFTRGDGPGAQRSGGLGVGLALARRFAELHGGHLTARSDGPGKGSEFVVRLPLAAEQSPAAVDVGVEAPLPRVRILVADDNRDAAESLGLLLEIFGAEVRIVGDGAAAIEAFANYDPVLVLLDIGMPEIDGYEVARRLRARFPDRRITLVALTGWGQEEDRRRAHEAGFDQHLTKPVDLDTLRTLLASLA
jgi:signal transduction histidine kinase